MRSAVSGGSPAAASADVKNAQGTVLHALYGVGTDVTVTKTPKGPASRPVTTPPSISDSTTPTIPVDPNDCDGVR